MELTKKIASDVLQKRAKDALANIETLLRTGQLGSEKDLITSINQAWKYVFATEESTSVEVPNYREGELPLKEMLETPLYQASNDIYDSWDQLEATRARLKDLFNLMSSEITGLTDLLGQVQNKATTFQLFSSDSEDLFLWASDSFTSKDKIDQEQTTAFVDTNNGVATLTSTSLDNLNKYISSFTVDKDNSSGIPGNNLEVSTVTPASSPDSATPEPTVTLSGETDLHSLIGYAFDQSSSTWFEWENVYVPTPQKLKQTGTAWLKDAAGTNQNVKDITWNYGWNKYVQWPGEDTWDTNNDKGYPLANFTKMNTAKLVFTLKLDQPRRVSTITLSPKVIGGTYPIVRSLTVSSDGTYYKNLAKDVYLTTKLNESLNTGRAGIPEGNYSGIGLWTLEDKSIQYIKFALEADNSYTPSVGLGHQYYFQVLNVKRDTTVLFVHFTSSKTEVKRLPNPDSGIQMGNSSGIHLDTKTLLTVAGAALGCCCAGTMVYTAQGEAIPIEQLTYGDGVIGWDNNKATKERISSFHPVGMKPCVRITTKKGFSLECSDDHPIVWSTKNKVCRIPGTRKENNGYGWRHKSWEWKYAGEIQPGEQVAIIREVPFFGEIDLPNARMIGMLIGDGSYGHNECVTYASVDPELQEICEKHGAVLKRENQAKSGGVFKYYRVREISKQLHELGLFGQTSTNKRLPDNLHLYTKESLADLIGGLYDTDGYVVDKGTSLNIGISQISKPLLRQLRDLLIRFGVV